MRKRTPKTERAPAVTVQRIVGPQRENMINRYKAKQLEICGEMLTRAGVPEWVIGADSTVPASSVPCRLKWYLARRKDVEPWEGDEDLQREMQRYQTATKLRPNSGLCGMVAESKPTTQ